MAKDLTAKTISIQDVIDTYNNFYRKNCEYNGNIDALEPILYFLSNLTNISVDELCSLTIIGNM